MAVIDFHPCLIFAEMADYGTPLLVMAPGLAPECETSVEVSDSGKHSNLLPFGIN
jgi:hypothetical protein